MNKLKILLKNNFNIFIGGFQGKKKRKSTATAITLICILGLGILALYSVQAMTMFNGLGALGLNKLVLFHGIITTLTVMVILGVMRTTAEVKHSDNDLLLSLPLKKKDLVISKTINKYLFDLFFAFILLIPFIVIYQIKTNFSIIISLLGLCLLLILPLMSVGISYICDFIVTRLFNRSKYSKLLKSLFSIIIFIGVMALMLVKTFGYGNVAPSSMEEYFSDRPVSYACLKFITTPDLLSIIIVIAITILPISLGVFLYTINFGKTFSKFNYAKLKATYKYHKPFNILFLKEIKNYFTTPAYVINTIIGPILMLILSVTLVIVWSDKINQVLLGNANGEMLTAIILLAMLGLSSMTTISSPAISLESKNIWIIKHLPINTSYMFLSKSLLHMTIMIIPTTISCLIIAIFSQISLLHILLIFILTSLHISILSFGGLFINLIYPMLEWSDPTKPIKSGISTLLGILLGFILTLIPVGIQYLFNNLNYTIIGLITFVIYVIILIVFIFLLFTKGKKLFNKL